MASFNEVLLLGNLTRAPELRSTSNGTSVCKFGLAVNRKFKSGDDWKEDVCFVDITVWGNQGENCAQYLDKGSLVFISGRLSLSQWETDDGQKRSKLEVTANNVQFLNGQAPGAQDSDKKDRPDDDIPF